MRLPGRLMAVALAALVPVSTVAQTGVVAGTVRDSATGAPVNDVSLTVAGLVRSYRTGPDGRFAIPGLSLGRYELEVRQTGYVTRQIPFTLRSDSLALDIVLTGTVTRLAEITVIGSRSDLEEVRQRLRQVPGATALVSSREIRQTRQANLKDVLGFVPGVYVQPRFGAADESQISIRGSGLRNNFHARGVNLLVNGMPYRNADGFTDFESLELLTTEAIEVYKGATPCAMAARRWGRDQPAYPHRVYRGPV